LEVLSAKLEVLELGAEDCLDICGLAGREGRGVEEVVGTIGVANFYVAFSYELFEEIHTYRCQTM